jgi:hypothetical protein
MSERSHGLIAELASDLEPVRRISRLRTIALGVLLWAGLGGAVLLAISGARPGLLELDLDLRFLAVFAGLCLMAFGGLAAALGSSVPGRERLGRSGGAALALGLILAAGTGFLLYAGSSGMPLEAGWGWLGMRCLLKAGALAVLPAALLGRFVARAAPFRPLACLAAAAGGALAFGTVTVHLSCPAADALHVLLFHALAPLLGGAVLFGALYLLVPLRSPATPSAPTSRRSADEGSGTIS